MILPAATKEDLLEEQAWVLEAIYRMDSIDQMICFERWSNRREGLVDHLRDVREQLETVQ